MNLCNNMLIYFLIVKRTQSLNYKKINRFFVCIAKRPKLNLITASDKIYRPEILALGCSKTSHLAATQNHRH